MKRCYITPDKDGTLDVIVPDLLKKIEELEKKGLTLFQLNDTFTAAIMIDPSASNDEEREVKAAAELFEGINLDLRGQPPAEPPVFRADPNSQTVGEHFGIPKEFFQDPPPAKQQQSSAQRTAAEAEKVLLHGIRVIG